MKQLVIRIDLSNHASAEDGEALAENILDGLSEYDPEETGASDTRSCIQDINYTVEDWTAEDWP